MWNRFSIFGINTRSIGRNSAVKTPEELSKDHQSDHKSTSYSTRISAQVQRKMECIITSRLAGREWRANENEWRVALEPSRLRTSAKPLKASNKLKLKAFQCHRKVLRKRTAQNFHVDSNFPPQFSTEDENYSNASWSSRLEISSISVSSDFKTFIERIYSKRLPWHLLEPP